MWIVDNEIFDPVLFSFSVGIHLEVVFPTGPEGNKEMDVYPQILSSNEYLYSPYYIYT